MANRVLNTTWLALLLSGCARKETEDAEQNKGMPGIKEGEIRGSGDIGGMARIPAGNFVMGCSSGGEQCDRDVRPAHKVWLSEYWMDKTEVTTAAYRKCVEAGKCSAPHINDTCTWNASGKEQYPVNCVNWSQANGYCEWAEKRLPTEAEWEKAARGGATGASYGELDLVAWHMGNSGLYSHPVGRKQPNAFGLFDMLGNVEEWCADWYGEDYYQGSPGRDPSGPESGTTRILRGVSWDDGGAVVSAFYRHGHHPDSKNDLIGFRCARSAAIGP